ncbi:MAG: hypothetical protein K2O97_11390, partial [Acetatifactor sp.]|nr:hypothetical protein [Acetatifactor sp.]
TIHNPGSAMGVPTGSSLKQPHRKKIMEQAEELRNRTSSLQPSQQTFSRPVLGRKGKNTGKICIQIYRSAANIHNSKEEGIHTDMEAVRGILRILSTAYRLHTVNRMMV